MVRGSRPGSTRGAPGGGARLPGVSRDRAVGGAGDQLSGTRRLSNGALPQGTLLPTTRGSPWARIGWEPHRTLIAQGQRLGNHLAERLRPAFLPGGGKRGLTEDLSDGRDGLREPLFLFKSQLQANRVAQRAG